MTRTGPFPVRVSNNHASWFVLIMPYLEQENISKGWVFTTTYVNQTDAYRRYEVKTYYCPSRRSASDNLVHQAEQAYPADVTPPPNFTPTGTADPRFSGTNLLPAGPCGGYAARRRGRVRLPRQSTGGNMGWDRGERGVDSGDAGYHDGADHECTREYRALSTERRIRFWLGKSMSRRECSGGRKSATVRSIVVCGRSSRDGLPGSEYRWRKGRTT